MGRNPLATLKKAPGHLLRLKGNPGEFSFKRVLLITLALKAAVLAVIYAAFFIFPFNAANYQANFVYPQGESPNIWTPLKTWDGQIYLYLAGQGYGPHLITNAFYPLFPFLIRVAGGLLGGNHFLAGLLLSHLFTFLAVYFLFKISKELYGDRAAFYGCLFLLCFPMGFYLGLIYTESLFLLLAAGYFFFWSRNRYWPAALCAFLMPLTRPIGILVLIPALICLWEGKKKGNSSVIKWMAPAGFLAGYAVYLLFMKAMTGGAFSGFEAEKYFIFHFDIWNLFHPFDWFVNLFTQINSASPGIMIQILNRLFLLLYLWVLWAVRKDLNRSFFVYCLVLGLSPALSGNLGSYMRYLLVLFPLFPVLALKCKGKEGFYVGVSLALQAYFAVQQALNYFVS
jgi:Gpi18-like mannosyltransferase